MQVSCIGNCREPGLLLLHCFWAALGPLQLDPPASAWSRFAVGKGARKQLGLSLARASSLCWQPWSFSSWCCVGILGARQPEGRHCPRGYVWSHLETKTWVSYISSHHDWRQCQELALPRTGAEHKSCHLLCLFQYVMDHVYKAGF